MKLCADFKSEQFFTYMYVIARTLFRLNDDDFFAIDQYALVEFL
jgi:hypothetical protein